MQRILIVEDDIALATSIKKGLDNQFEVEVAFDGLEANNKDWSKFDLVILDWNIPYIDGLELLRNKRYNKWSGLCLMLTAKSEDNDLVFALDYGADDYLTKPFNWKVLNSKINALLRHLKTSELSIYNIRLNQELGVFEEDGREVGLTSSEFKLLLELISNPTKTYNKHQLMKVVYNTNEDTPESNVIEKHIALIRKKFNYDPIKTIYGVGYRLQSNTSTQKNQN
jgi:two-component system, OmpR family, response regulator TctD